ncbi:gliding motility-associated ABC transporter ATP-binding subunit GldA [Gaoshiqia sp. Z1-71]|uniref:gliding motility-associated ABC transporter ATP-binding subunit GldA n=1 Tax=Gaoshiqia hydrogeniformans TaxID=3290090 RepID=UPI003BF81B87
MSVQIQDISKFYGKQKALDKLSVELRSGELVGFLGPNGAGKSTLMKIITGYLAPDHGSVFINGQQVTPENHRVRMELGYLPEHNPLYTDLYIREYLTLIAGFYHLPEKRKKVEEVMQKTGLGPEGHKKIKALSKGYRQRVGLAQALIHDPSVLILDEPTTGLDPNQLEEIRSLIREISREKTVLFSTHIMQEVEAICTRVIIINQGRLIADGPVDEVKTGTLLSAQQVFVEFSTPVSSSIISRQLSLKSIDQLDERSFLLTAIDGNDLRPAVFRFAVDHGLILLGLNEKQASLERIFRELTQKTV